jgi:hypothetical protein
LSDIWQAMLSVPQVDTLGDWQRCTVTTLAVGTDARRTLISTDLVDEDTSVDATRYASWFVYVPATMEQARVRTTSGWTGSTGTLLLNGQLAAALPTGTVFYLIQRLGVLRQQGLAGLRDAANAALHDLAVSDNLTLAGTGGLVSLASYPWLTQERILGLYSASATGDILSFVPGVPTLRWDADTLTLEPQVVLGVGDTAYLKVARPAYTWINVKRTARATATVVGNAVTAITVADVGTGYTSVPTVTISGGGGSGATAVAVLSGTTVASVTVTAGGTGYTSTPTVTIAAPAGAYAASTVGLVNDEDEVAVEGGLDVIVPVALYHAFLGLARGPAQDTERWQAMASRQAAVAAEIKRLNTPESEMSSDILEAVDSGLSDGGVRVAGLTEAAG